MTKTEKENYSIIINHFLAKSKRLSREAKKNREWDKYNYYEGEINAYEKIKEKFCLE